MKKNQISKNDIELLSFIAQCRVITASQLSLFTQRSDQVIRRRLRAFEANNLILKRFREFGRTPGRPENLIFLSNLGFKLLKSIPQFTDYPDLNTENAINSVSADHDLLVNWCWLHLLQIEKMIPNLSVKFHTRSLPLKTKEGVWKNPFPVKIPPDANSKDPISFFPDALIVITKRNHHETKKLLLFLEVDMGTETIATLDRKKKDVREKILNYKRLFQTQQYRRYENIFNARFNGFRLLFLCNTFSGLTRLCRLTQEMAPSDFIWLTDQGQMFANGLADNIWIRGGQQDNSSRSVLGPDLACKTPVI